MQPAASGCLVLLGLLYVATTHSVGSGFIEPLSLFLGMSCSVSSLLLRGFCFEWLRTDTFGDLTPQEFAEECLARR
jgi:hypothetical protein